MPTGLQVQLLSPSQTLLLGSQELVDWREKHNIKVPGHEWDPMFKRGRWDGHWAPMDPIYAEEGKADAFFCGCSRGLAPRVAADLGLGELTFPTATQHEVHEFIEQCGRYQDLRDFQAGAFRLVLEKGWGRIAFATNAGKGAVFAMLAAFAEWRGDPVLILCDEISVFDALEQELETWGGLRPALVRAGATKPPTNGVVLAMVPTLAKRVQAKGAAGKLWAQWLLKCRMLLMDEADKADNTSWRSIIAACKNTVWRAGFSGTFSKELYHELRMEELMGPVLDRVTNMTLVERGISARPSIYLYAFDATEKVEALSAIYKGNTWWQLEPAKRRSMAYETAVIYNQERHAFIARIVNPDTSTVIIVNRVDHGAQLEAVIPGAVFVDGSRTEAARREALEEFAARRTRVLIVTKILDRGSNRLGSADELIFASGEGSSTQILQRIGRGLRRTDGKASLNLIDIVDKVSTGENKQLKSAAGPFHNAAMRRLQVYNQEGFDVAVVPHPFD